MHLSKRLPMLVRLLIEQRFLLSLGLSVACGIVLTSIFPLEVADPILRLIALAKPSLLRAIVDGYGLFLYTTPFLVCSMVFSLLYVHLYREETAEIVGPLPPGPIHGPAQVFP